MSNETRIDEHAYGNDNKLATKLWNAEYVVNRIEGLIVDSLLSVLGVDSKNCIIPWPFDDISFDPYDQSLELSSMRPGLELPTAALALIKSWGFTRCWLNYTDCTERYYGVEEFAAL